MNREIRRFVIPGPFGGTSRQIDALHLRIIGDDADGGAACPHNEVNSSSLDRGTRALRSRTDAVPESQVSSCRRTHRPLMADLFPLKD